MHLSTRSQSTPRAIARMCPCPCALRCALSTARLPHEVNKEQADTALHCGIGLRVGLNTACGQVCRVPSRNQKGRHRAPNRIFRKIEEGQCNSLHRAYGGSSDGKRGKFPLKSSLVDFKSVFYISDVWKIVKNSKNLLYFCKKRLLNPSILASSKSASLFFTFFG